MIVDLELKNNLKKKFSGSFYISGINNYIDEIDSIYKDNYKTVSITVYYRKKKDDLNKSLIKKVLKRGFKTLIKTKSINIYLLLTPLKKTFETDDTYLTPKNVNSGFTITNSNDIYIFRKEEFPKVILHEIIHHNNLINSNVFKKENYIKLCNFFNISYNSLLILNEAVIEFWAFLQQIMFVSKEYNIDYKTLFKIELYYSLFKCAQIFKLQETMKNNLWYDKCNIFSYIVFKTIFLYNLKEFIKIYTYPYDDTKLTDFLIKFAKKVPINKKNPKMQINKNIKFYRPSNSLCFMLSSDL